MITKFFVSLQLREEAVLDSSKAIWIDPAEIVSFIDLDDTPPACQLSMKDGEIRTVMGTSEEIMKNIQDQIKNDLSFKIP